MIKAKTNHHEPTCCNNDIKNLTFLRPAKQRAVLLQVEVDIDQISTSQELHDHSGGKDRADTKFHECSPIRREDNTHPIERVGRVRRHDTVQRNLRANEEN